MSSSEEHLSENPLDVAIGEKDWSRVRTLIKSKNVNIRRNAIFFTMYDDDLPLDVWRLMLAASGTDLLDQGEEDEDEDEETFICDDFTEASFSDEKLIALIEAYPQAAAIDGLLARSLCCDPEDVRFIRSPKVICQLLTAHPSSLRTTDEDGIIPLDTFFNIWNVPLRFILESSQNDESIIDLTMAYKYAGDEIEVKMKEFHEITMLVLQATMHGTVKGLSSPFQSLFAAIITPQCPWSFAKMILRIDPKQAYLPNKKGNLPIHVAAATKSSPSLSEFGECMECNETLKDLWYQYKLDHACQYCIRCFYWDDVFENVNDITSEEYEDHELWAPVDKIPTIIKDLIAVNSKVASIPNHDDMLPLNIAIQNDKLFDDDDAVVIFRAAPSALSTKDIGNHMYSFMLAAIEYNVQTKRKKGELSGEFLNKFTSCFSLLMENPVLVSSGIPRKGYKRKQNVST